jgi:hypothetical protein
MEKLFQQTNKQTPKKFHKRVKKIFSENAINKQNKTKRKLFLFIFLLFAISEKCKGNCYPCKRQKSIRIEQKKTKGETETEKMRKRKW